MLRKLAVAVALLMVVSGCTAEDGEDTTTTAQPSPTTTAETTTTTKQETTTTAETVTTTTLASGPTLYLAKGGTSPASAEDVPLAPIFGEGQIRLEVLDQQTVTVDTTMPGTPGVPVETELLIPRWRTLPTVDPDDRAPCAYKAGEVVIDATTAENADFRQRLADAGLNPPTVVSELLGTLGGAKLFVAEVEPDQELGVVLAALASGGLASLHYPVPPQPKWKYGPATAPVEAGALSASDVGKPEVEDFEADILVLDHFSTTTPRDDANTIAELYESELTALGLTSGDLLPLVQANKRAVDGHGEFILEILERLGVRATGENVSLKGDTTPDEQAIASRIAASKHRVISLSLGTAPCTVDFEETLSLYSAEGIDIAGHFVVGRFLMSPTTLPPIGLAGALRDRAAMGQSVNDASPVIDRPRVVAAAGNSGDSQNCILPWYPAALANGPELLEPLLQKVGLSIDDGAEVFGMPDLDAVRQDLADIAVTMVGVGATSPTNVSPAPRAGYSQCPIEAQIGPTGTVAWVPGTNVIGNYEGALHAWSGTSFATPVVAAAIVLGFWNP